MAAKITTPIDIYVAAMAALRVFVTVGSAAFFWIVTAWPAGDTFLTWVGLASCRYVIAPSPARATAAAFRGMLIATVPTYLITFYLMPQMDGFAMFVLALFPFLFFGVGIGTSLRRPVELGAAILLIAEGLDPANEMQYDVVAFFNGVLATILGVGTVFLRHRLVFPSRANQRKVATLKRLTQRTVRCIDQGKISGNEPSVRKGLSNLLRSAGLKVQTFASAKEFLINPPREGPSCLVLDVKLPGISGLDLQEELANGAAQIPIIFLTGYGDIPMTVRAIKAAAIEFLTKAFRDEDLLNAVDQAIKDDSPFVFAGLWEGWQNPETQEWLRTCSERSW